MKKFFSVLAVLIISVCNVFAAEKIYNVDVCVVGAGAGGTTAAVSAQEAGLKTILLEKMPFTGGAGNFMEGSFAAESFMQKQAKIPLTKEQAFNNIMKYHHWKSNAELTKAFVDESSKTIQWVWDHGVHYKEVKSAFKDNPLKTWHIYPTAGAYFIRHMVNTFLDEGGTLLLETPGKQLLFDKNGKISGVLAENYKGETIQINAKYVVLATGGYANNIPMIVQYGGPESVPTGPDGRMGDGIKMAMSAGAELDNMGPLEVNGAMLISPGEAICNGNNAELRAMFRQSLLYVNSKGERFFNEQETIDWPMASNAIGRQGKYSYVVFDADTLKEFQTTGYLNPCGNWIKRGQAMKRFDELFPQNVEKGYAFQGATLEEVAKKAGMDPETLKKTAEAITKDAETGYDAQFGKDKRFIRAVAKGPFYVLKGQIHHLTTLGGAKVNGHLQVINKEGNIIPGLYAIGHDAGGLYGDSYDLTIGEGTSSAFAINGGRMAVKDIIQKSSSK
ncbi:FAD-dependent oxidoreductase [Seleniivibrio sp.]|uniref:FAD-dependent oxidoreductase n=1 Tax=Seleniivibrio sp. TaxID=2898801 RepID=UPI0025FA7B7C|nr:FAD-dependent oxidoreductase [Seleniivibrio sp.]MCD8552836.1 FAD-dependent oxidoreductase [Seleniivibrio sp.]